jgi:hypothetical protein
MSDALILQENAETHKAAVLSDLYNCGWEVNSQPLYVPHKSPSDFNVFLKKRERNSSIEKAPIKRPKVIRGIKKSTFTG